jgi:hypothetical protein
MIVMVALLGLLTLVSYVDRVYTEMGKFLSREFQDNIEAFEQGIEAKLGVSRSRAQLSMAVLTQLTTAAIALMIGYTIFEDGRWDTAEILEAALSLVIITVVFNRLLPFVFFTRTEGKWLRYFTIPLRVLIYLALPVTLILGFALSVAALAESQEPEQPEHPSEAVDALIEAGQEEGILEESDRRLIQSVVEFGDKTVREVMTPRPDIAAVPLTMTLEQFIESQRTKPFSRMPVYDGTIDNIKGIVLAHDALQVSDTEARVQTGALRAREHARQHAAARIAEPEHAHGDRGGRIRWGGRRGHHGGLGGGDRGRDTRRARGQVRHRARERHFLHRSGQHGRGPAAGALSHSAGWTRSHHSRRASERDPGAHRAEGRGSGGGRPAL